jgi:hypothetical protein
MVYQSFPSVPEEKGGCQEKNPEKNPIKGRKKGMDISVAGQRGFH